MSAMDIDQVQVNNIQVNNHNELDSEAEPSQLIRDDYLSQFGLVINGLLKALVCEECGHALIPNTTSKHLYSKHGASKFKPNKKTLEGICTAHGIPLDTVPEAPTVTVEAYEGLALHKGFLCHLCNFVAGALSTMDNHYSSDHKGDKTRPAVTSKCSYQQINPRPQSKKMFLVKPPVSTHVTQDQDLLTALRSATDLVGKQSDSELNARNISPWLLASQFHIHTQGFDHAELSALVTHKLSQELPTLPQLVKDYCTECVELLPTTWPLVLKKLNTPDHAKTGIENTPFKKPQQSGTLDAYCTSVTSILSMLLREKVKYQVPLPSDIVTLVEAFRRDLSTDDQASKLRSMHTLLVALWSVRWDFTSNNTMPDPTIRALALRSIRKEGFAPPHLVTPDIAKFEYMMRLAAVRELRGLADTLYGGDQDRAYRDVHPWMQEQKYCTFDSLRNLQHQASSLAFNAPSLPDVWWTDKINWRELMHKGKKISMDNVVDIFAAMEKQTVEHFEKEVLCGLDLRITYDGIVDDLTNRTPGYSFLSDPANTCFHDRDIMMQAILNNPVLRKRFLITHNDGSVSHNVAAHRAWQNAYGQHGLNMCTSAEMKGGAPGRLTELWSANYRNTTARDTRGLVILNKHVSMNRTYVKTGSITGLDKLIPHSMDAVTGDILIQDLALVRPFAELSIQITNPGDKSLMNLYRHRLFIGNRTEITTERVSDHMERICNPFCAAKVQVRSWRQMHAAFGRKLCGRAAQLLDLSDEETAQVLQYGHGRSMHEAHYGISNDAVNGPSEEWLPEFLDASTEWQRVGKIVPGGSMLPYKQARSEFFEALVPAKDRNVSRSTEAGPAPVEVNEDAIAAKVAAIIMPSFQAMLESTMAKFMQQAPIPQPTRPHIAIPARLPSPEPMEVSPVSNPSFGDDDQADFSPIIPEQDQEMPLPEPELEDHISETALPYATIDQGPISSDGSLEYEEAFIPAFDDSAPNTVPTTPVEDDSDNPWREQDGTMEELMEEALDYVGVLTKNPSPQWRSEGQKQMMAAVLERKTDVVAILGTNGGKSAAYEIPQYLEAGYTFVIIPLVSLMLETETRLTTKGIPFERFQSPMSRLSGSCNLILVTVDAAKTNGWIQAISELHERGDEDHKVLRGVSDEAHLGFTSEDFRWVLKRMYEIRNFPMQLVLLSATVPPNAEAYLKSIYGLKSDTVVIRNCTVRAELEYILTEPPCTNGYEVTSKVVSILKQELRNYQPRDRATVFVAYKNQGADLVKALGTTGIKSEFYHGELKTAQRQTMADKFSRGVFNVLVATNSWGTGGDYPHVRTTIHAENPTEMVNFTQEMSRAGRDSQSAKCFIIRRGHQAVIKDLAPGDPDYKGKRAVAEWLYPKTKQCLRYGITLASDGEGVHCRSSNHLQLCSFCAHLDSHLTSHRPPPREPWTKITPANKTLSKVPYYGQQGFEEAYQNSLRLGRVESERKFTYLDDIRTALEFFSVNCALCLITEGIQGAICANPKECPTMKQEGSNA